MVRIVKRSITLIYCSQFEVVVKFFVKMISVMRVTNILLSIFIIETTAGISPVHDFATKINAKLSHEKFILNSPHKALEHLDNTILKATKNVTQNPEMEGNLYQISKDLVSAILTKLEIQDKITRITREALDAPGKTKGMTAIETRRILDYISRTLSGHILTITRASTEPELHRLVFGLAQIAAEVSIVSALKDITYATALSKKQSVDLSLRKKRSVPAKDIKQSTSAPVTGTIPLVYRAILNKPPNSIDSSILPLSKGPEKLSPYSVISKNNRIPVQILTNKKNDLVPVPRGFLNQTALDIENKDRNATENDAIVLDNKLNGTHYVTTDTHTLDTQETNVPSLVDDWIDPKENIYALNPDVVAEMEIDQPEIEDESANEKKIKQKLERMELKAKKAILYAGDVAYLAAASVVAMRRALTASIEVHMSVKYAKNGMANHQDLMMNLAKTAAQQAGKEAKSATSKSLACERVIKLALKYTAQSKGAKLNHVANRVVMDTLSLATLAKSMAFVSSDIAINSLYQATDVKPPS
ncbi:uncharacterized protein LOC123875622 isoform X1 [Maniola jurtina]|uniref:uncharacterized protein LOC123875622 isoform X1 n=1 Tax=Maniola jurtina TaxID=191418 RepID=UPI001E68B9B9|nr:uncharacterized protein LOC123875622 isoform X1 [Maniola jurtina]